MRKRLWEVSQKMGRKGMKSGIAEEIVQAIHRDTVYEIQNAEE